MQHCPGAAKPLKLFLKNIWGIRRSASTSHIYPTLKRSGYRDKIRSGLAYAEHYRDGIRSGLANAECGFLFPLLCPTILNCAEHKKRKIFFFLGQFQKLLYICSR
jgi:hypothetical protein